MPSPRKRAAMEAARAAEAARSGKQPAARVETPIDDDVDSGQSSRSGLVFAEGELEVARSVASRMGWTPREKWTRDPTKWVDAPEYLERTPAELARLQERNQRATEASQAAAEEARRRQREQAAADLARAREAGDIDAVASASQRLGQVSGPDPEAMAWVNARPWMREDPAAAAVATATAEREARAGKSTREQLEAADREVRRRFPEHYEREAPVVDSREEPARSEQTLTEAARTRARPAVTGGSPSGGGRAARTKEKGYVDLPADAKASFDKSFRPRGIDPEAYAKRYFANVE